MFKTLAKIENTNDDSIGEGFTLSAEYDGTVDEHLKRTLGLIV